MESKRKNTISGLPEMWRITMLVVILVCGFGTRLYDLTDPPLDYAPSRQLRSAIISRGIYYQAASDVPDREREVAMKQMGSQEMLEPEIMENLVALAYSIVGGEYVWIARVFSSLFWTLGGLALYNLTREAVSDDGAVVSLLYYLFVPFALIASRTFQPDPLMTAAIIFAWLSFYRWAEDHSWKGAWLAGLAAGLAILIKSTAFFFLFFGMAAALLWEGNLKVLFKNAQMWLIAILSAAPAVIYHLYGYFISGEMKGQLRGRLFNASFWLDPEFYSGWLATMSKVLGHYLIILIALIGLILVRNKILRRFLIGSWLGFVVYGFAVSYYVTTHSYYLLPLIPLAAITIGAAGDRLFSGMKKIRLGALIAAGEIGVLVLGISLGYFIYRSEDFRHEPGYYSKVASFVTADDSIMALSQDYGFRLAYYGLINVQPWVGLDKINPSTEGIDGQDSYSADFRAAMEDYDFFIITRMKDFRQQTDLNRELTEHYPVLVEGGGYVIFDLSERME